MTMNNTKTKTAFGEFINDIRAYICDARDDRFDLQEAHLGLRRAKNAVKNMSHGQLDNYEAENAIEMASNALGEYDFHVDSPSCMRIVPIWMIILLLIVMLIGQLFLGAFAAIKVSDLLLLQDGDALYGLVAFGSFFAVCLGLDFLCCWLFSKACNFIVKRRVERLDKIIDALDNFLQK